MPRLPSRVNAPKRCRKTGSGMLSQPTRQKHGGPTPAIACLRPETETGDPYSHTRARANAHEQVGGGATRTPGVALRPRRAGLDLPTPPRGRGVGRSLRCRPSDAWRVGKACGHTQALPSTASEAPNRRRETFFLEIHAPIRPDLGGEAGVRGEKSRFRSGKNRGFRRPARWPWAQRAELCTTRKIIVFNACGRLAGSVLHSVIGGSFFRFWGVDTGRGSPL